MIRKGWTAYAAFLTVAIVTGEVRNLAHGAMDARTFANWVLTLVLLLATWGYALRRPIGAPRYWGPAFWVVSAATLITIIPAAIAGTDALIVVAIMLLFAAPAFYAAYRYAFHSPDVWQTKETTR